MTRRRGRPIIMGRGEYGTTELTFTPLSPHETRVMAIYRPTPRAAPTYRLILRIALPLTDVQARVAHAAVDPHNYTHSLWWGIPRTLITREAESGRDPTYDPVLR